MRSLGAIAGVLLIATTAAQAERYEYTFNKLALAGPSESLLSGKLVFDYSNGIGAFVSSTLATNLGTYSAGTLTINGSPSIRLENYSQAVFSLQLSGFLLPNPGNHFAGYVYDYPGPEISEYEGGAVIWSANHGKAPFEILDGAPPLPGSVAPPVWEASSKVIRTTMTSQYRFSSGHFIDESNAKRALETKVYSSQAQTGVDIDIDGYTVKWRDDNTVEVVLGNKADGIQEFGTFFKLFFINARGEQEVITDVRYNRHASGINSFLGNPYLGDQPDFSDFNEPKIKFGPTSFQFIYADLAPLLIKDKATHVFDIQTTPISDTEFRTVTSADVTNEWWWPNYEAGRKHAEE